MKQAIIDLGTNTFHLMIASKVGNTINEEFKLQIPVKIGAQGINEGYIGEAAFQRGLNALAQFRLALNNYEIQEVTAFGTSAIRDAKNGSDFIQQAKELYQINIEAISGDDEAKYIYEGVRHSFPFPTHAILVMDIGGGSVEFIIGQQQNILWKKSYPIGAARLIDLFGHSEPIAQKDIQDLVLYLTDVLGDLIAAANQFEVGQLVGSAGSFETLRDVLKLDLNKMNGYISDHACSIALSDFEAYCHFMLKKNLRERSALKGMLDFRVDMIVVATLLMQFVVNRLNIKEIIVSDYALKEGMLFDKV